MNPIIELTGRKNENVLFKLMGINVSLSNALRRTVLSDIPIIVFRTMEEKTNKCKIFTNTSRLNNEILKQRLSCIPIHIKDGNFPFANYNMELNVENTTENIQIVTTADFTINDLTNETKLSQKDVREIFPPFSTALQDFYIDFMRLRPGNNTNLVSEKIHLICDFDVSTAKENGMFNVVSTCAYGFTVDDAKLEIELQKKKQQWKDDNKNINDEEKNWRLLDGKRITVPDSFDFRIKSVGVFTEYEILEKACNVIIKKLKYQETLLETDALKIEVSNTTLSNSFDITLDNEDYTIGKAIEFVLYDKYYNGIETLSFCGFSKTHPHDDHSTIRLAYKLPTDVTSVKEHIKDALNDLVNVYLKLREQCKKIK
jgi:DNA-directed RNA polymerase subunit L|tara:strand:- start:911 stop:2023 length:1113 start_codon:yes stop_codon:yes gene_type:complete